MAKDNGKKKQQIVDLLGNEGQLSVKDLSEKLDISLSMTHRHVRKLLEDGILTKIGSAPRVFYSLKDSERFQETISISETTQGIIEENFLTITARGKRLDGWKGFVSWCNARDLEVTKKAEEYIQVFHKYDSFKNKGVISGNEKMQETFGEDLCLDDVFYADFYAWEIFGKTKLGQLLLYAKQSQDRTMMKEVVESISPIVQKLLKDKKIDAVGFIPPTVKRQTQFMKVLDRELKLSLPTVEIVKVRTDVITPQKTLNKLEDRITNANATMIVTEKKHYKNILLIDDAVGSGATLNQVACKIKKNNIAKQIYGFAVTGSAKGFDVISEV